MLINSLSIKCNRCQVSVLSIELVTWQNGIWEEFKEIYQPTHWF